MLAAGIWGGGSFLIFSLAQKLWMIYLAGFLVGLFGSNCVSLCANVIVQQSYDERRASGILGLVMAGSGVGGVLFNLIIPGMITDRGWQAGMRMMGLCWACTMLLAGLVLGKTRRPEGPGNTPASVGLGMTRQEALKSPNLYLMVLAVIAISVCCGLQQQPSLLAGYGFPAEQVSLILSVQTAVLAAGKVTMGLLFGSWGARRGGTAMLLLFAAGMLMLTVKALVYPALIFVAFGLGIYTTLLPVVTRQVFGTREYASIWSLIATAGSVGTVVLNPLWGLIYDASGSYTIALVAGPVLLLGAVAALNRLLRGKR